MNPSQLATLHASGHTILNRKPIAQLNRKLHDRLTAAGFLAVDIDFNAVDPLGDFVTSPDLPICTLVRSSVSIELGGHAPMCLFNIPRGVVMEEWFVEEEDFVYTQLVSALMGSLVKQQKERELQLENEPDI